MTELSGTDGLYLNNLLSLSEIKSERTYGVIRRELVLGESARLPERYSRPHQALIDTCMEEADDSDASAVVHKSRSEAESALSFENSSVPLQWRSHHFHRNSVTDPGSRGVTVARKLKMPGRNAIADNPLSLRDSAREGQASAISSLKSAK